MIIPLNHENMTGRRWPYVTLAIIVLNTLAFLGTHWTIERETQQLAGIEQHIILLAAAHPSAPMTPAEENLVDTFRRAQPKVWDRISLEAEAAGPSGVQAPSWEDQAAEEMTQLGEQLTRMQDTSILARYAFVPSRHEAVAELKAQIAEKPDALGAYEMLPGVYWRKSDVPAYLLALETVCQLHLKAHNTEAARQDYDDYSRAGGNRMPAATWLEFCRQAENEQKWEEAVQDYGRLATAWPGERASVLALISAGRISLRHLERREDAVRFYKAAQQSPIPHADWDETIRKGLDQATSRTSTQPVGASPGKART